jgi:uncharacterized protein YyaL (SSP411 family)
MWRGGALLRSYRKGHAGIDGYCEDYACLIAGLLELFQADGDPSSLAWALDLQRAQDERFWDDEGGGWFSTTGGDPSVVLRLKEDYDGAEPSASSVAAANLLMMAGLSMYHAGLSQLVIAGDPASDHTRRLRQVAAARYLPFTIVVPAAPAARQALGNILPFTAPMDSGDRAAAYLCHNFVCESPIREADALDEALQQLNTGKLTPEN